MRFSILTVSLVLVPPLACTPASASEDEASVTTVMSGALDESTTGTNDTADSSQSSSTDEGVGFWDAGELDIVAAECNVWMQDCPAGEKCVPFANAGQEYDDVKCVPITGDQAPGEPCVSDGIAEATDDCDATSICFDLLLVEGQLAGTCYAQCTGSLAEPMCPPASECWVPGNSTLALCMATCDPIEQDCDDGLGCYWDGRGFGCFFESESGLVGEPCGFINDCMAGTQCVTAAALPDCLGSACCTPFCDSNLGSAACSPDHECVPFFEQGMAPAGYESVGVCVVP